MYDLTKDYHNNSLFIAGNESAAERFEKPEKNARYDLGEI